MVGRIEGHQGRPAGGGDRRLQGDLHRLRTGEGEEDLGIVDRRQGGEALGQLDPQGVAVDVAEGVQEDLRLGAHGGDHRGVRMADGGDAETGGEIEEDVAVDVADIGAPRLLPEEAGLPGEERVDTGGLHGGEALAEGARPRPRRRGDEVRWRVAGEGAGAGHISRRPASERPSVTSSVYSMSPPTGMPKARRVTLRPRGLSTRAR